MRSRNTLSRLGPLALALVLALSINGCQKNVTVPTPPQIQVANAVNVLAHGSNTVVDALTAARDNGTISQADLTTAFTVNRIFIATGQQIKAEMSSTDTWEVQKAKILKIIVDSGVAAVALKLPPTAKTLMIAGLTAFNAISAGVGGPQL